MCRERKESEREIGRVCVYYREIERVLMCRDLGRERESMYVERLREGVYMQKDREIVCVYIER